MTSRPVIPCRRSWLRPNAAATSFAVRHRLRYLSCWTDLSGNGCASTKHDRHEETGDLVRYTYRPTANFESEFSTAEPMFAVKPEPEDVPDVGPADLEGMIALACQIREEQDQHPAKTRISIGGELVVTVLEPGGMIGSIPVYRFSDYDDMWEDMNTRLADDGHDPLDADKDLS